MHRFVLILMLFVPTPPVSAQGRLPDGTGTAVHGRIMAGGGTPLRRARVTAAAEDGLTSSTVLTDDEGRFALDLSFRPPFTLDVTKAGFAPHAITVSAGPETHDIGDIVLFQGGVISGRVLDSLGNPAIAEVTVLRADPAASPGSAQRLRISDDRGEFRFGSLPAGEYHVYVERSSRLQLEAAQRLRTTASEPASPNRIVSGGPPEGAARVQVDPDAVPPDAIVSLQPGREVALILTRAMELADAIAATLRAPRAGAPSVPLAVPVTGRSTIRGRVLDSLGAPVALARVDLIWERVSRSPVSGAVVSSQSGVIETTVSDGAGGYQFTALPAGSYGVRVQRVGYGMALAGISSPPGPQRGSIPISGEPGVETIDVTVQRTSAIEGRVLDEWGEPLEDIAVQAWLVQYAEGQLMVAPRGAERRLTDDRGVYRLHGLPPGTYYVVAAHPTTRSTAPLAPPRVFHPASRALSEATPIRLGGVFDAAAVDLVFDTSPPTLARLWGRIVDDSGEPLQGTVTLITSHRTGVPRLPPQTVALDDRGVFEMTDVPPGEYVLHAVQAGLLAFPRQFARQYLRVADDSVPPLQVRTSPGSTITGRLVLQGVGTPPLSAFRFEAVTADPDEAPAAPLPGVPTDGADRRPWAATMRNDVFDMGGLTGPLRFAAARAPEGWWLKSVEIDGRNAVEDPVMFGTSQQSRQDVRVVFSDAGANIAVSVTDERDGPARGAAVMVFPQNQRWWFHRSPYVRRVPTDANGQAALAALPPGDYWVVAVDDADEGSGWQRPEVLHTLAAAARQLTLRERDRASVVLRLVRGVMR